jgi:hypothetical protein
MLFADIGIAGYLPESRLDRERGKGPRVPLNAQTAMQKQAMDQ